MDISCENEGCTAIVKLDALNNHLIDCEYSPKKLIQCQNGCGMTILKDDLLVKFNLENKIFIFNFKNHNCIQVLCTELDNVKNELEKYKNDLDFYKNEVRTLQVNFF